MVLDNFKNTESSLEEIREEVDGDGHRLSVLMLAGDSRGRHGHDGHFYFNVGIVRIP